jgi:hypothetical protein
MLITPYPACIVYPIPGRTSLFHHFFCKRKIPVASIPIPTQYRTNPESNQQHTSNPIPKASAAMPKS